MSIESFRSANAPNFPSDSIERARQALWALDPDMDRDTWVQVAMAAKSAGLAFGDFNHWSAGGRTYVEQHAHAVWRSIDPAGRVGSGTLYFLAKKAGHMQSGTPRQKDRLTEAKSPTSVYAKSLWLKAGTGDGTVAAHPYAIAKDISWAAGAGRAKASGAVVGKHADCLIVPIRHRGIGRVQGVQVIDAEGRKQTFGEIRGGTLVLGNTQCHTVPWFVCEGWASAVSTVFHHHRGNAVCAVAFGKSNLRHAAEILSTVFAPSMVVILEERA